MSDSAILVSDLTKEFRTKLGRGRVAALQGISFDVRRGEVFGLLGPNGAGKTTTVKILLGLTRPTSGFAQLLGTDVSNPESRRRVGYLPEGHRFPGYLTPRETLSIFGRMAGVEPSVIKQRTPELLERLKLSDWIDVRVKKFSKGMTQRLGIAASLIHDPEVLLLDEPTDGVDPVGRREIRDLLREEAKKGRSICLNSHLLSEIELMCDRVAALRRGKIAAFGSIAELTKQESRYRFVASAGSSELDEVLAIHATAVERQNGHYLVSVPGVPELNRVIDEVRASGAMLEEVTPIRSTLEDVFVGLVRADQGPSSVGAMEKVN
jgi:ABC-2 type transport system ATP-binding protein